MAESTERVISSATVHQGRLIDVRQDTCELPDGRTYVRETVVHPGAVAVVALTSDRHVSLVRQRRSSVQQTLLELPAGTLEPPEPPADCARRELAEEVGLAAARWTRLASFYSSPGFCTELLHVYLAEELSPATGQQDDDEQIEIVSLPLLEALARITSGEIRDAKSVAGLLLANELLRSRTP